MEYPKAKKKKKAVSDSRLGTLWRQAAKAYWPRNSEYFNIYLQFVKAGAPEGGDIECHHIIKRRYFPTRWDYRNGFPIPHDMHMWIEAHPMVVSAIFANRHPFYDYLCERQGQLKPDFLRGLGLSENEYRISIKKELTDIVKSCSM